MITDERVGDYPESKICRKCGSRATHLTRWHSGSQCTTRTEHLHMSCAECRFAWVTDTYERYMSRFPANQSDEERS